VLAEGTVAKFHVGHLELIEHEEMAAILAHLDRNVRRYVLKVAAWIILVEVAIVNNVNFFKPHRLKHELIDLEWLILLRHLLIHQIQQLQRKCILHIINLLAKVHHLLLILIPLGDGLLTTLLLGSCRLILFELGVLRVGLQEF